MTIKEIAKKAKKNTVTVQRWVRDYNKVNSKDFESGTNSEVNNQELLLFIDSKIKKKAEVKKVESKKKIGPGTLIKVKKTDVIVPSTTLNVPSEPILVPVIEKNDTKGLKEHLSADWLIVAVLIIILWCDMFAFGVIGGHEFGDKISYAGFIFSIIGLATGIGSVVTFNRISNDNLAETWKWIFGVLQFSVFSLTVNEYWFWAETVMTLMFVLVFVGVQRAIKK